MDEKAKFINASLKRGDFQYKPTSCIKNIKKAVGCVEKTLERQPLIDPNREERHWKDDSARRYITHKNFNKTAF
jgi:hypothetical protein